LERVERREGEAHFGPQRRHDQLLASGGFDRLAELGVLPGVDRRPIDLAAVGQHLLELEMVGSRTLAATPTVESTIARLSWEATLSGIRIGYKVPAESSEACSPDVGD
jgi:hypothetical protein